MTHVFHHEIQNIYFATYSFWSNPLILNFLMRCNEKNDDEFF